MKKVVHLLLMLVVFQGVSYAAYSWDFKSVRSNIAGIESLTYQDGFLSRYTTEPHSGTVTVRLTALGDYSEIHRVRYQISGATAWTYLEDPPGEAIVGADYKVAGYNFDYEVETVTDTTYIVQVINLLTTDREDQVIINTEDAEANVFEMEEGDERGEWPETRVVRAYCPAGSQIISGYCKIWDGDELEEVPSYNPGTLDNTNHYYECRNPYSIGEDRYTRVYAECYQ